jgi:hypothetical protein
MKTELAELNQESLMRKLGDECFFKMKEINPSGGIKEFIRIAVEFGYKKSQSNPKIKQLEWDFYGNYYEAKTQIANYVIYQSGTDDHLCILDKNDVALKFNLTIDEAKAAAQEDFEESVKKCLDISQ